jgi:type IV pilus assembly protein PilA
MKIMKNQKTMGNKGFSLVELIVVIAIMAVLVGVLAPQFIKYVEKSKESTDIQNLDSLVTVVQTYYADKEFPGSSDSVTITGESGTFVVTEDNAALVDAGSSTTKVKGNWSEDLTATIKSDGSISYTGDSDYYELDNGVFKAKNSTDSGSGSGSDGT